LNAVPVKPSRPLLADQRWVSNALPARRPLYSLKANLAGFQLEASVHPTGTKGYAVAVLLDNVHVPSSPAGGFATLQAAITAAKATFSQWSQELLRRV
jgi:hypothetical protein